MNRFLLSLFMILSFCRISFAVEYSGPYSTPGGGGATAAGWTDAGTVVHTTTATDDVAIGGTNTSAPFYFDESQGDLTISGTQTARAFVATGGAGSARVGGTYSYLDFDTSGNGSVDMCATGTSPAYCHYFDMALSVAYADGEQPVVQYNYSADQLGFMKVKNNSGNVTSQAAGAGIDLDVPDHYDGDRARTMLYVRDINNSNSGGSTVLTTPKEFRIYAGNEGTIDLSSGELPSSVTPPGILVLTANTLSGEPVVGIGITDPEQMLHIEDTNRDVTAILRSVTSGDASLKLQKDDTTDSSWILARDNTTGDFGIDFSTDMTAGIDSSQLLTIKTTGDVGIGTTNPQEFLHAYKSGSAIRIEIEAGDGNSSTLKLTNTEGSFGTLTDADSFRIHDFTDNATRFAVDGNGNVGIGTTAPVSKIHISGIDGSTTQLSITNTDTGVTSADGLKIGFTSTEEVVIQNRENTGLHVYTNDLERMTILSGGNVGIGTTNPGAKLEVSGETKLTGVSGDGTGKAVCVKSDGNLGTCSDAVSGTGTCICG